MSKSKGKSTPKREDSLLETHPEVTNNARGYFRHENGKVIVEDRVGRGDQDPWKAGQPMNQGDLTDDDLKGLAIYAIDLVDPILKKYDERVAIEDAVYRAIGEKDGGKYAGKVNATTSCLIADYVEKKANNEKTGSLDYGQSDNGLFYKKTEKSAGDHKQEKIAEPEEVKMSRQDEIKVLEEKLASLKVEAAKDEMGIVAEKVANDPEARSLFKKLLKEAADKKGDKKEDEAFEKQSSDKKEEKKEEEACDIKKTATSHIIDELDKIAADLEAQNDFELFKIAYQIDQISDVIDGRKEASTLEGDVDESFMKKYFKAGKREGDSDEKYMGEFNTDVSKEVSKVVGKKSKTASSNEPYSVISEHND